MFEIFHNKNFFKYANVYDPPQGGEPPEAGVSK